MNKEEKILNKEDAKEKAAFEAFPEDMGYSTIADKMVDYNIRNREVYKAGFDAGYVAALNSLAKIINLGIKDLMTNIIET